ncbi:MAG: type restriction enzyme subunit [Acidobacteriota bacterium]|jgi:type I restriction enzyme R subunit|nr:type restriction enzyme subunit [Acidobacteriota bacterium]
MTSQFYESDVEAAALFYFEELGYQVLYGPDIAPDEPAAERKDYSEVFLLGRLRAALTRINEGIKPETIDEAVRKVIEVCFRSPNILENNSAFHSLLCEGVPVEIRTDEGRIAGDTVRLIDFTQPESNDWLAVNQFTVLENINQRRAGAAANERRPDLVVFINGLPLGLLELKNAADPNATIKKAWNQLQTYKRDMPNLCSYNEVMIISDGLEARAGTISSDWERFMPWRTITGETLAPKGLPELETLIKGIFDKQRFLELLEYFITFETNGAEVEKKMAGYHQFHAVNKAVESTVSASSPKGDRRVGVIWHTQGSGKSLSMLFYAGKIIRQPEMANPTLVVLTDRNDLDEQLFGTFAKGTSLLRQNPVRADSRADLRDLLQVASGGVIFTTIQKFLPENKGERYPQLSDRRNIVFIADEAHRSQYGFAAHVVKSKDEQEAYINYGFAQHLRDALPYASFIGFTGTPIELNDRSTRQVFGDVIDTYDIQQAVEDGATVRIYYEARLAKLELQKEERPRIDEEFEEITEGEEVEGKERLKSKWARLEAMVGTEPRIAKIAQDIVEHFERRLEILDGKGMIVCMSRRICADLYDAIVNLRPHWHDDADDKGFIKVVMTGSAADPAAFQPHIRSKPRREKLADEFKKPSSPIRLVIVRDMWLTGFDAPSLHTMYVDKPMQGHGLMQAIARVNRVFKDKQGGLVVDYLGLADQLKQALSNYTAHDREQTGIPIEQAVYLMQGKYEVVADMMHGFDYTNWTTGTPAQRLSLLPAAMEHVLEQQDGKKRFMDAVTALARSFALAVPHEQALAIRDDVAFFQAIRAGFTKATVTDRKTREDLDSAIRQIVSRAVVSNEIVDIFHAAGLKSPDISILSDEFLAEVRDLPQRNLAVELLRKLLSDDIKARARTNLVQARSFADLLERSILRYQNRSIEAAAIIEELVALAKEIREANQRGENLGLTDEELAFYDALEVNDNAVKVLGDETLKTIARELVETVRKNATIDWTMKESVRARLRTLVKRLLRKYGYPPDKQEKATQTVLEQAELLCKDSTE